MKYSQIQEAEKLAPLVVHSQSTSDVSPALVVQYVPLLGTGATAATAKVTAAAMVFTTGGTTPSGLDYIGSSTGNITFGSYDSLGEVLDVIEATAAWRAYLVAGIGSDASTDLLAQAAASAIGANGLTFYFDTSAFDGCGTAISGEKFINNSPSGHVKDADDECLNQLLYVKLNVTLSDGELTFYSASRKGASQIGPTYAYGSASAIEVNENGPAEPFLVAKRGERLVIRAAATTAGNGTPAEFRVEGKTAVYSNNRIVTEDNY